jgi:hypothetical protein
MMTPLDLTLASAGRLAIGIEQVFGGSRRAARWVVVGLLAMSAIPTFVIGSSQRPTDLTFDDVRLARIPAMTTWVRLAGDLRPFVGVSGNEYELYELHDLANDQLYIAVTAPEPLPTGVTVVTGRLSLAAGTIGSIGTIDANVPAIPKRDEPFGLILLPAAFGIFVALGIRVGYPVIRRDRPPATEPATLRADERLAVHWSGRIGSEVVARRHARPAEISIDLDPDPHRISITDDAAHWTVLMRRSAPVKRIRLCGLDRVERGFEIHARADDVILTFESRLDRDRAAATLLD